MWLEKENKKIDIFFALISARQHGQFKWLYQLSDLSVKESDLSGSILAFSVRISS